MSNNQPEPSICDTDGHEYNFGVCVDCEDIDETYDPTPDTREQITAGYVNPSYERLRAWEMKRDLTR
jgi:hypothetical protein